MTAELCKIAIDALEEMKGKDIISLDVMELSNVMDTLIIATGTSNRHVKSLVNNVVVECKKEGFQPIGVEGMDTGDWVLVDFGDVVVHAMLAQTREFYDLEKLWSMTPAGRRDDTPPADQ